MGLENNSGGGTFVNIKEGKLYTSKKGEDKKFFDAIRGTIVSVKFEQDSFDGTAFEKATFTIADGNDKYLLQMRTDSGYFRGLCNSLKSGNPTERTKFTPSYKKEEGETPKTTFFVEQNGKTLKHTHTRDNVGDLPPLEQVTFKGKTQWDGSNQIVYWKDWLNSIEWEHELFSDGNEKSNEYVKEEAYSATLNPEIIDDLPF